MVEKLRDLGQQLELPDSRAAALRVHEGSSKRGCKHARSATVAPVMRMVALLALIGCAHAAHRTPPPPSGAPAKAPAALTLDAGTTGVEVASADELRRAFADNRTAVAQLVEVVEVRWRDLVLDRAALGEMIAHHHDSAYRQTFVERYHITYDDAWRVFLHGYEVQLGARFGILPVQAGVTQERGRWLLVLIGVWQGEKRMITWTSGAFSHQPGNPTGWPLFETPPPPELHTVETVLYSERSDYYALPERNELANFKAHGDERMSDQLFVADGFRMVLEQAEYRDLADRRYRSAVPATRPTRIFRLRPGGLPRLGLNNALHVARLELDGSILPGQTSLIENLTVIDGTPEYPVDLKKLYGQVWERFDRDARTAETRLAAEVATTEQAFANERAAWAKPLRGSRPMETARNDYTNRRPQFRWNAAAKTLTVTFVHEHAVRITSTVPYPNPALEHFNCPPGRACAVPPRELAWGMEQRYKIEYSEAFEIDRDGTVRVRDVTGPKLTKGTG
jgi:hypothetical protein